MSWTGTVYCGYCGNKGHNKLSCPQRKEHAIRNPDSYLARTLGREKESRQRAIENRKCSYCRLPGHNRRGCEALKNDKSTLLADVAHYRMMFLREAARADIGIGTLVNHSWRNRDDVTVTSMITGINWEYVDPACRTRATANHKRHDLFKSVLANVPRDYEQRGYYDNPPVAGQRLSVRIDTFHSQLTDCVDSESWDPNNKILSHILVGAKRQFQPPEGWLNPSELEPGFSECWHIVLPKGADDWSKRRNKHLWDLRKQRIDNGLWA